MLDKFIPSHFINNFQKVKENNYYQEECFIMFADLSGFTKMSEKLSGKGDEGSEVISQILNTIFEDLITLIKSYSGSVYKFGGDAVTVVFSARECSVECLLQCSVKILEHMKKYYKISTIGGNVSVGIKLGLARGEVLIGSLGDQEKDYFLAGDALDQACEAEHNAVKGDIILHESILENLQPSIYEEVNKPFYKLLPNTSEIKLLLKKEIQKEKVASGIISEQKELSVYVRDILLEKEKTGAIQKGELRNTAIIFLSFTGVVYDENFNYQLLNRLYTQISKSANTYGGFVNKIDMGDKGSKIIILFGAPKATEHNEEYAFRCALDIKNNLPENVTVKIGIHSGAIYFGVIGAENRKEFAVIGSPVNISARLMTACTSNEIVISEKVKQKVQSCLTENERELVLKGIKEPFPVATLAGFSRVKAKQKVKIIGKKKEQAFYAELLKEYLNNQNKAKIISITAEAGLGKSVLASRMEEICTEKNIELITVNCLTYTQNNSFYILREILNLYLNIDISDSLQSKKAKLKKLLGKINEAENLEIFASFLDWQAFEKVKENDTALKELFTSIALDLFNLIFCMEKTVLFIDDLHWIDEASLDFLKSFLNYAENENFLLHLIFRPEKKLDFLKAIESNHLFLLENLEEDETRAYLKEKFQLLEIPEKIFKKLYDKTKGNPFFSDEIIHSIKQEGKLPECSESDLKKAGLSEDTGAKYFKFSSKIKELILPENLTDIVLARIDQLDENSKSVLKVASVIGRIFQFDVLKELQNLQVLERKLNLKDKLFDLTKVDLTLFESSEQNTYLFKHIITQEVAYKTLLFNIRRKYHEKIGDLYEDNYQSNLQNVYEILAFHYKNSNNKLKAKDYTYKSAKKAYRKFSYSETLNFLKEYRRFKLTTKEEKAESYLLDIEILKTLEKRKEGIRLCNKLKKGYGTYYEQKASILKGQIYYNSGDFRKTIKEIDSISKFETKELEIEASIISGSSSGRIGDSDRFKQSALFVENNLQKVAKNTKLKTMAYKFIGFYNLQTRNIDEALKFYQKCYKLADLYNFTTLKLQSIQDIGTSLAVTGEYKKANKYFLKAFHEAKKIHNFDTMLLALNNIAKVAYVLGKYKEAEEYIEKGLAIVEKFKKEFYKLRILKTAANIKFEQKKYDEALKICEQRRIIAENQNNLEEICDINDLIGDIYFKEENYKKSLEIYKKNIKMCTKINNIELIVSSKMNIANCYDELDLVEKSLAEYNDALKLAKQIKAKLLEAKIIFDKATLFFADKQLTKAFQEILVAEKGFKKLGYQYGLNATLELKKEIECKIDENKNSTFN